MTVAELIEALRKHPPDMEVVVQQIDSRRVAPPLAYVHTVWQRAEGGYGWRVDMAPKGVAVIDKAVLMIDPAEGE